MRSFNGCAPLRFTPLVSRWIYHYSYTIFFLYKLTVDLIVCIYGRLIVGVVYFYTAWDDKEVIAPDPPHLPFRAHLTKCLSRCGSRNYVMSGKNG